MAQVAEEEAVTDEEAMEMAATGDTPLLLTWEIPRIFLPITIPQDTSPQVHTCRTGDNG